MIQLKKILNKETFNRVNNERKAGRLHIFTTEKLLDLINKVADAQPSLDSTPNNAAESARHRQLELSRKRQELIKQISTNPPPPPAPIARKVPLNKLPRINHVDRALILCPKLDAVLTRLCGFDEVGSQKFFDKANGDHVRSFRRGFHDLHQLAENLDEAVKHLEESEWKSLNWGFTLIKQVSLRNIRENFTYTLKCLAEIFDNYFLFISIDK